MAQLENFRLKVFRTVGATLSFRKAAEQLFLTQPAVTLQIKGLEKDLGLRLFDRGRRGVTLTAAGATLLRYANQLARLAAEAEEELGVNAGSTAGTLSLGVSTTIAQYVLPRLLGPFLREFPGIQLSLRSGNTQEVVRHLLEGEVAIGLIEGPAHESRLRSEPFMQDELVLIVPADFAPDSVSIRQLQSFTLLIREQGSGTRDVVESALKRGGAPPASFASVIHLDSTETIKSAVEAGLGAGFVSRWSIQKEIELGTVRTIPVQDLRITRHFSIVSPAGVAPHGLAGIFRKFAIARAAMLSETEMAAGADKLR